MSPSIGITRGNDAHQHSPVAAPQPKLAPHRGHVFIALASGNLLG